MQRRVMIVLPLLLAACQGSEAGKKTAGGGETGATTQFARTLDFGSSAGALYRAGDFAGALKAGEIELAAALAEKGAGKQRKVGALLLVGKIQCRLAKFKDADKSYQEAMDLLDEKAVEDRLMLGAAYNGVAELRYATAEWEAALTACRKGLSLRRKGLPTDHPDLAESLANYGVMLLADPEGALTQAMVNEAHRDLVEAWKIRKKVLGEDAPETADSLKRLGVLFFEQEVDDEEVFPDAADDDDRALRCLNRSLDILRRALPAGHPDIGESILATARMRQRRNDSDAAARLAIEARDLFEKSLGKEHPAVGFALDVLGSARKDGKRWVEAVAYYERAQNIFENAFGPDHYFVGVVLQELSDLYSDTGDTMKVNLIKRRLDRIFGRAL